MSIRLIYASSEQDANLRYWSRMWIYDPFLAFEAEGRRYAISNALEIDEMRRNSGFDEVLLASDFTAQDNPKIPDLIQCIGEKFPHHEFLLPQNFPAYLILKLQERGIKFSVTEGEFLPERSIKSAAEVAQIRKACEITARAFAHVRSMLANATIVGEFLYDHGEVLTSERIRSAIEKICFEGGALARGTIVACGQEAAFPHNRGSGKVRANEFIVVDIFPRLIESGYHGDMTRTFLKGQPSKEQQKMYQAVLDVQNLAIANLHAGKTAREIHKNNVQAFEDMGYASTHRTGFFHSTGHGVGLELHEHPFLGDCDHIFQVGEVVTIEPGLYYPQAGGVRIEDVFMVGSHGPERLSEFPYDWIL
ncbi:MAG: Xaa-Pro peptidase family protein [Puniceicoccales bacterium]|jgi:Xaa-Pro aminopeptidase|nr:Xaa-Pro peptidase family protein [Puniceicoccales bacterium]